MAAGTSGEATTPADCILVHLVRHGQTPLNESGVLRGEADRTAGRRRCRLEVTTAQHLSASRAAGQASCPRYPKAHQAVSGSALDNMDGCPDPELLEQVRLLARSGHELIEPVAI